MILDYPFFFYFPCMPTRCHTKLQIPVCICCFTCFPHSLMWISRRMWPAENIDRSVHNVSPLCVLINSIDLTSSPSARSDCLFTIRGRLSRLLNSPPPSAYKQWNHQLGNKSGDSSSIPLWEVSNNQPCWSQAGCRQIQARGIDRRWLPSISLYLLAGKSAALCMGPLNYHWGRHHFGGRGSAEREVYRREGGKPGWFNKK